MILIFCGKLRHDLLPIPPTQVVRRVAKPLIRCYRDQNPRYFCRLIAALAAAKCYPFSRDCGTLIKIYDRLINIRRWLTLATVDLDRDSITRCTLFQVIIDFSESFNVFTLNIVENENELIQNNEIE